MEERRVLAAPTAVPDAYTVAENGTLSTTDADGTATVGDTTDDGVLANDLGSPTTADQLVIDTGPSHGLLLLNPDGTFTYTNNGDESLTDSFTYHAINVEGESQTTVTITITPVDDLPTGLPNTVSTNEDTTKTFTAADFGYSDPDGPGTMTGVKITNVNSNPSTEGTLYLYSGVVGTAVTDGQVISIADIDAGNLRYVPPANANGSSLATFDFQVQNVGGEDPTPKSMAIDVLAVNDAPVSTGAAISDLTVDEDAPITSLGLSGLDYTPGPSTATDENSGQTLTYTVTHVPDPALGVVVLTDGVTVVAPGTYTLPQIQGMKFIAAPNANGSDTFEFDVTDDGVPTGTLSQSMDINVDSVNDAPTGADNTVTVAEDDVYTFTAADFGFADSNDSPADNFDSVQIVTLPGAGSLTYNNVAVTANQIIPVSDLGNLKFTPDADESGPAYATFDFKVIDDGGTNNSGVDTSLTPNTITIDVTEVNETPTANAQTVTTSEDTDITITLTGDDGDANANQNLTYTISSLPTNGTLYQRAADGSRGAQITTAGTDVTDSQGRVIFCPTADENASPYATFQFTVTDNGTTAGAPDPLTSSAATVTVNVTEENDPPIANPQTVSTAEDTQVVITLSGSDGDNGSPDVNANQTLTYTVASLPTNGKLYQRNGDGSLGAQITAPNTVVTNASHQVIFVPDAGENASPYATFTFTVTDNGTTAGAADPLTSPAATVTVNVTEVNDTPTANVQTVTTTEDTQVVITLTGSDGDNGSPDVDANQTLTYKITSLPTDGKLYQRNADGSLGTQITATGTVVTNPSNEVIFIPDAGENASPYATFAFTVTDDGTTAGAPDPLTSSAATVTVNVTEVNDTPTANAQTVTTSEDNQVVITLSGSDGDNASPDVNASQTLTYTVATLPTNGKLYQRNSDGSLGTQITAPGTVVTNSSHQVIFVPDSNENSSPYATFTFTVSDNGTTDGVADPKTSAAATVTVNVTEVNETPTANAQTVTTTEDTQVVITLTGNDGDNGSPDIDANQTLTYKITSLPTNGKLYQRNADGSLGAQITSTGTVVTNPSDQVIFIPDAGENASPYATFAFTVTDDGTTNGAAAPLTSSAATVTVNVTEVNDAPTANAQTVTTSEDNQVVITLSGSDGDNASPDVNANQTLTYTVATLPTNGKLYQRNSDGSLGTQITAPGTVVTNSSHQVIFVPDSNENSSPYATFTFTVSDNGTTNGVADPKTSTPATVTVNVTEVNDTPTANAQTVTTDENAPVVITLTGNDGDNGSPDSNSNQTLTYKITSLPAHGKIYQRNVDGSQGAQITATGTVVTNPSHQVIFVPDDNTNGNPYTTFQFTVTDDGTTNGAADPKTSTAATVRVNVVDFNSPPIADPQTVTTAEDTQVTITLTGDDGDNGTPDDNADQNLTYKITSLPTNGKLYQRNSDGSLGAQITATGTVVTDSQARVIFVPDANENANPYATFQFTVTDDGTTNGAPDPKTSAPATVRVNVTEVNDTPTANAQTVTTAEDTEVTITLTGDDGDNATPDVNSNQTLTYKITSLPTNGTLYQRNPDGTRGAQITAVNTVVSDSQGRVIFVPDANENAVPYATFQFSVTDNGTTNGVADPKTSTSATVTVNVTEVNDTPTANAQTVTTAEDNEVTITLTGNDNDNASPDVNSNQTLTYTVATLPTNGTLYQRNPDGTRGAQITTAGTAVTDSQGRVIFVPNANDNGSPYSTFTFTVTDNGTTNGVADPKTSTAATVTINVTEVNDAPTTNTDTATVAEDGISTPINVIGNDSTGPANESAQTLTVTQASALHGTVIINLDNTLTYTPDPNYNGPDTITYTVRDNGTTSGAPDFKTATGTVNVTVTEVNDAPTATPDTATLNEDGTVTINLINNDSKGPTNESGQTLTVTNINTAGTQGTVTDNHDGTITFTPAANFAGTTSFTYTVTDNGTTGGAADPLTSNIVTVTYTVQAVADTPNLNIVTTSLNGNEGDTLALNWSGGLADTDGSETLVYELSGVPANAVITDANGVTHTGQTTYTFTQSQIGGMTMFFPDNPAPGTPAMTLKAISTEQPGPGVVIATPTATNQQSIGLNVVNVAPTGTAIASQIGADQRTDITGTINEPGADTVTITYIWGDPGAPNETTPALPVGTTTFAGGHTYVLAPNPANPAAPVPIAIVLTDDEGASTTINITAPVAGTGLTVAIAPPPAVELAPIATTMPIIFAPNAQTNPILILNQTLDQSGAGGEAGVNVERLLVLNVISPTGDVIGQYEITDKDLADLPNFFKNFPNGRYQIFVLQAQGKLQKSRLVIDVEVRQGKPIAPGDDGEGTRDRPPGSASNTNAAEQLPNAQAAEERLQLLDRMWEKWRPRGELPATQAPLRGAMLPAGQTPAQASIIETNPEEAPSAFQPPLAGVLLAGHMAAYALDRRWSEEVDEAMSRARPKRRRFLRKQS